LDDDVFDMKDVCEDEEVDAANSSSCCCCWHGSGVLGTFLVVAVASGIDVGEIEEDDEDFLKWVVVVGMDGGGVGGGGGKCVADLLMVLLLLVLSVELLVDGDNGVFAVVVVVVIVEDEEVELPPSFDQERFWLITGLAGSSGFVLVDKGELLSIGATATLFVAGRGRGGGDVVTSTCDFLFVFVLDKLFDDKDEDEDDVDDGEMSRSHLRAGEATPAGATSCDKSSLLLLSLTYLSISFVL
jgi:hypothetical protein